MISHLEDEKIKKRLRAQLLEWLDILPVYGFNSSSYDINVIKKYLPDVLMKHNKKHGNVSKAEKLWIRSIEEDLGRNKGKNLTYTFQKLNNQYLTEFTFRRFAETNNLKYHDSIFVIAFNRIKNEQKQGVWLASNLSMEEFAYLANIKLVHVPYKGSSLAMNDLLGGNVDLLLSTSTFTAPYVKSKRVRALGVAGQSRLSILPDVPTFEEQGVKDFNVVDSKSLGGPRGIAPEIVAFLNTELNSVLKDHAVYTRLEDEGTTAVGGSPDYMLQLIRKDIARWKKVIDLQKITPQS